MASNISRHRPEVFSLKSTPDVAVADAVRLSMSIPLYFEALRFDGTHFGDGDFTWTPVLYDNYPLELFDDKSYVRNPRNIMKGSIGKRWASFWNRDEYKYTDVVEFPKNLWEFVALTGKKLLRRAPDGRFARKPAGEKTPPSPSAIAEFRPWILTSNPVRTFTTSYKNRGQAVESYFKSH